MTEWQRARIIPVSGIGSDQEAEQRATSALLAVSGIVRPFSHAVLSPIGASRADKGRRGDLYRADVQRRRLRWRRTG
jgi:hypothetical protein